MQLKIPFPMDHPSEQLLTRIDAFMLRSLELDRELTHKELEKRIKSRYGVDISVRERLKEYIPPDDDNPFIYWR